MTVQQLQEASTTVSVSEKDLQVSIVTLVRDFSLNVLLCAVYTFTLARHKDHNLRPRISSGATEAGCQ